MAEDRRKARLRAEAERQAQEEAHNRLKLARLEEEKVARDRERLIQDLETKRRALPPEPAADVQGVYVCICVCVSMYVYVPCICMCICIYTYTYTYII